MFHEQYHVGGRPVWMYEWVWFKYKVHEDPRARKTLMGRAAFREWLETVWAKYERRRLTENEIERIYAYAKEHNTRWSPDWEKWKDVSLSELIEILTIT